MAVVDELPQGLEGVVFAFSMVIMLDTVHLDAAVVLGKGTVILPCLLVGLDGVDDPILLDEMRRGNVGDDGEPGGCHLSRFDEAATAHEVLLAPVAALATRREALYRLPIVNAFHGAVYPPETQGNLNGIDIADHTWTVRLRTVDAQPEVGGLIVVLNVPLIKLLSGMDVKQCGDFHYMSFFYGSQKYNFFRASRLQKSRYTSCNGVAGDGPQGRLCSIVMVTFCFSTSPSADNISAP